MTASLTVALLAASCAEREIGAVASLAVTGVVVAEPVTGERTAMYFTVRNRGDSDDELVAVSTPVAGRAEIHRTYADGGMRRMEAIASLPVAAGEAVNLAPGGVHVMLLDLDRVLWAGDRIEATLHFRAMGEVAVVARVVDYAEIEEYLDTVEESARRGPG